MLFILSATPLTLSDTSPPDAFLLPSSLISFISASLWSPRAAWASAVRPRRLSCRMTLPSRTEAQLGLAMIGFMTSATRWMLAGSLRAKASRKPNTSGACLLSCRKLASWPAHWMQPMRSRLSVATLPSVRPARAITASMPSWRADSSDASPPPPSLPNASLVGPASFLISSTRRSLSMALPISSGRSIADTWLMDAIAMGEIDFMITGLWTARAA
mmetsp:Transcript_96625/g.251888  ORF Transcript_96625/g.251888 Transcript_96625/m.251888 type:complete len:216 (-) Transcript_96625:117-764(-)